MDAFGRRVWLLMGIGFVALILNAVAVVFGFADSVYDLLQYILTGEQWV